MKEGEIMKKLIILMSFTSLLSSLPAFSAEKEDKQGMMDMHKKHMKCVEEKGHEACQEMMMKDCKMNREMCMQMMENMGGMEMQKGKNEKKEDKQKTKQ
jgi:hypothetical protein